MKDNLSFIHSSLNGAKLSLLEFRLYCHVLSVAGAGGVCWQSIGTISREIGLNPGTVRDLLKTLVKHRMLTLTRVNGRTNEYRTTDPAEWVPLRKQTPRLRTPRLTPKGTPVVSPEGRATALRHPTPAALPHPNVLPDEVTPQKGGEPSALSAARTPPLSDAKRISLEREMRRLEASLKHTPDEEARNEILYRLLQIDEALEIALP